MMKRFATLAAFTVAALSLPGQAHADYRLELGSPTPTTFTGNGTTFNFATAQTPQIGTDNLVQPFNVINVAEPTASGAGSGSFTLSETFTITGFNGTPGLLTGTLTGTFTINPNNLPNGGALSGFTGSVTGLSGSGFTVTGITYTQPSVGSTIGSPTQGNISFVITPTAVPEPTSVAVMGLGLAGLSFISFFRRRRLA